MLNKIPIKQFIKYFFGICTIAMLSFACSTKKSTFLTRAFHNTTAHYNGYFNAREIIRETERDLKENHKDDFSQIIPIFIYPDEKQSQALYPEMDRVIEKCSEVIERHSIYLRKKEHVKWIDDSYLLIGKARFYKQEYALAKETFLYVYQGYKTEPIRYQGLLWLIRSNIETQEWDEVQKFIDLIEDDTRFPEEYEGEFNTIYADYLLKKDSDYENAIVKLEEALSHKEKKKEKVRKVYVLAQLYLKQNDYAKASQMFSDVVKIRPGYTMEFNAKINRAIAYDVNSNNSDNIRKQLRKMLKDDKNKEFRDQIYFALAELELKEKNEDLGIEYLKKSAALSTSNTKQKALSYFRLANLYFEQPNYIQAQTYYDSTLQFLPKTHPDYFEAEDKNLSLKDLVSNLKIIELNDSLLNLSGMNEKDRRKKIEKLIENKKEEVERKQRAEEIKRETEMAKANQTAMKSNSGEWYFYNQSTLAFGRNEFKSVWGERELKDNWRRMNKGSSGPNNTAAAGEVVPSALDQFASEEYDPEFYLKQIPSEPKEIQAAHAKVAEALFNVGTIFKESFNDYPRAVNSFKRIVTDYDTAKTNLPSHYQLYRIYSITEKEELAQKEKDWILDNHPFSEYAYLIKDPNYNKDKKETKEKVEAFYAATYNLFEYGLYEDVINSVNKADTIFTKNHIQPKFDFLRAKAIGHIKSREEFKQELEKVIADYPEDSVKIEAQNILRFLNKMDIPPPKAAYTMEPKDEHILIVSIPSQGVEARAVQNSLSSFNAQNFRESKLQVSSTALNRKSLYMVRTFKDQQEATRYIKALQNNKNMMDQINRAKGETYLISNNNFKILISEKDEEDYKRFYGRSYV